MLPSFLSAFCISLAIGAAIAENDVMPEEVKAKIMVAHDDCKALHEGPNEPIPMNTETSEHECYYQCLLEKMGMFEDGKVKIPEEMPKSKEIQGCVDEKVKEGIEGCKFATVAQVCMEKFRTE